MSYGGGDDASSSSDPRARALPSQTFEELDSKRVTSHNVRTGAKSRAKYMQYWHRQSMPVRYFLQSDLDDLDDLIDDVRAQIRRVKLEAQEGTEQSSESWHDNYVFEEAQRQLKMLLNHLGGLSNARENAELVTAAPDSEVVAIGSRVKLRMNGHTDEIYIGSYMVGVRLRDKEYVSYEAPLAAGLLGARVSEKRTVEIGGKNVEIEVLEIG